MGLNNEGNGGDFEDIAVCIEEGRVPHQHGPYRIMVGDTDLKFQGVLIDDPVPTGRQVLEKAGLYPTTEYLLFAWLKDGALEEIRLAETVDLFPRGVERFIAFRSDRFFLFLLNDRRLTWGASTITGRVLKSLARVDVTTHGVWLEQRDEADRLIADDESVSLADETLERFRTAPSFLLCIEDKEYHWSNSTIATEEIAELGGWDPSEGVIEVDADQNERQLSPHDVVTLKPGLSYGKKLCWRRG